MLSDVILQTPDGEVTYDGDACIDGVPGTSAPIRISFLETAGSVCGSLLPTGHVVDTFDGVRVTCIDNGMPVVVIRAADLGRTGYETRDALNADTALKARIESIRRQAGPAMNLGDVTTKVVPKMSLIAPPRAGGSALLADLHSPRLPFGGRRAGRGDARHRSGAAAVPWQMASPCFLPGIARRYRSSIRPASSPSSSSSTRSNRRTSFVRRSCARRGSSCAATF